MLGLKATKYDYYHNDVTTDDYFCHHRSRLDHISILLIDDEPDITNCAKCFLESHGLIVHVYTEPLVALDDFQKNFESYSLVVSDINMKTMMTEFEFARLIRQIHPTIKIFLMSASDINNPQYKRLAAEVKADAFLQKPFTLRDMLEIIENHFIK
ncbi:MAG: response regulator [Nitrososphaeraceae archaeon]